jgi:hypothetical protein
MLTKNNKKMAYFASAGMTARSLARTGTKFATVAWVNLDTANVVSPKDWSIWEEEGWSKKANR